MSPILLNPGPVTLSDGVRRAAVAEDLCHREPEFRRIQEAVLNGLVAVYDCDPAEWQSIALGGSGTVAMEAMVASLLPADGALLVLENGVYGERLSSIADIHGIENASVRAEWGAPIDLAAVEATLASGNFSHLAMVHHETTTGRLNPLAPVADLCQRHGVGLLLDAVSSFGAEEIPFDHPALVACAATANKCLHGIPGLAFVLCHAGSTELGAKRSLYLDLSTWRQKQASGSTPFTPPVNAYQALRQALQELETQGGWRGRRARYLELAESVREHLASLGVKPWLAAADSSSVLRSYKLPEGLSYAELHDRLKSDGFVIYEGQGGLSELMFRISTMGEISDEDLGRLNSALTRAVSG
jgi:2-aminoethylphosphonate-pyruvate transaminase